MDKSQSYVPGMCNINKAEVAYRKKAMWFGVGLTVVLFAIFIFLPINVWFRLVLFVPIYIAAIGYLQVKNSFCVSYGASGKQNATDGNEKAETVTAGDDLAADKAKSRKMNLQALAITIAVLVVLMLIPGVT